jgi:cytochrome P450
VNAVATAERPAGSRRAAPGPRGLPVVGSLFAYWKDPAQFLIRTRYDHGPVSTMRMGPYTFTLATSPEAVRRVLIENPGNYTRGKLYDQFRLVMGSGLLTQEDAEWKPHRRVMQPAFLRSAMAGYFPAIAEQTAAMLARWDRAARAGEPVELVGETLRVASAIIMSAVFGYDVDGRAAEIKRVVDESIEIMFPHGSFGEMVPAWVPTARNRRVRRNKRILHGLAADVRGSRVGSGPAPLLDLIEEAAAGGAPDWRPRDVRDEILTIYLAGHETTAVALCWALINVANHRPVRERLEAEVDAELAGGEVTFEALPRLTYTEAVVSETLRMYPPIWLFPRDAVADDDVDGFTVRGGTSVLLSPLITHRDPEVWTSPEAFDPERFQGTAASSRPRTAYLPFGLGGRQCIGNIMAMLELRGVLAAVTQRFRLELLPSSLLSYGDSVVSLRPMSEVWVRLTPRSGAAS